MKNFKWIAAASLIAVLSACSDDSSTSSSLVVTVPDTVRFDANGNVGEFTDSRDGHVYKAVKIGDQVWMAENLAYGSKTLFTWGQAMDSTHTGCGTKITTYGNSWDACPIPDPVQGICPSGWHLPNAKEIETLFEAVGGADVAANMLKSTSGWGSGGNGKDAYGFNGAPISGDRYLRLWTSDYGTRNEATVMELWDDRKKAFIGYFSKDHSIPAVRCVLGQGNGIEAVPVPGSKEIVAADYGSMVDPRDGETYKTIVIGEQTWMAENLRVGYSDDEAALVMDANNKALGRAYYYDAAMNAEVTGCSEEYFSCADCDYGMWLPCPITKPQGLCPDGWRLPTFDDWTQLITYVDGLDGIRTVSQSSTAGKFLNDYGFTVLPVPEDFSYTGKSCFWSGSVTGYADWFSMDYFCVDGDSAYVALDYAREEAIRCIKGDGNKKMDVTSSSSVAKSSSSYSAYAGEFGTLKDERDGNVYKTVDIEGFVWMAENLKYETPDGKSHCNCGDTSSCDALGRLYVLETAVNLPTDHCLYKGDCKETGSIQGICPEGWHLPSKDEVQRFFYEIGGEYNASKLLKSTEGWKRLQGFDVFGFGAKPAGVMELASTSNPSCMAVNADQYEGGEEFAEFWVVGYDAIESFAVSEDEGTKGLTWAGDDHAISIRCLKD